MTASGRMVARYDRIGRGYARQRRPDPRIQDRIDAALGDARTVLNVGAGTGSYEPAGRTVVAIEPSRTMIDQRRHGSAPAVQGVAEALPVVDGAFDAAMAVMTVHHWPDPVAGLAELQRVAHRQVVLTFDFSAHDEMWWISEYLTEIAADWEHNAPVVSITDALDGRSETIPMPWDCTDGMLIAYWRRPERYLDPEVLASASGTALADPVLLARAVQRLSADLDSGAWRRRHADLLDRDELDVGVRLIVAEH